MFKSFKTEIMPTPEQKDTILHTIGVCRFIYNLYVSVNMERYKQDKPFINAMTFSVWLNNKYLPANPDKIWIKEVSSKAVKKAIMNAEMAYRRFFKGQGCFPRFKKKGKSDPSMYFVRNSAKYIIACERHRIKIPTLGWVRLKEYGYLPTNGSIRSGAVSIRAGRFFVSVLVEVPDVQQPGKYKSDGIGIDLGIKEFATVSNGDVYKNINKTDEIRRLEKKLRREQRKLSRRYEALKKRAKSKKGETTRQNIQKQQLKVQRIHYRLDCIRTDYLNKSVSALVKTKPAYITMEDLNVKGMMKNRHFSKAISQMKFYEFKTKLKNKCDEHGIEFRTVSRWFPSSKMCHKCGCIKKGLKLSDRIYRCECGYVADRDFNAALNLRDAKEYSVV